MSLFNTIFRKINMGCLVSTRRYLTINRYHLNDKYWAYKNNFIGRTTIHECLYRLLEARSFANINILQVGAHNGTDNNVISIREVSSLRETKIVLIEPNPIVFEELSSVYDNNPNVTCLNVAVSLNRGTEDFYTVSADDSLPPWANQLSSFDKNQILKSSAEIPNIQDFIVKTQVSCETYKNIVETHLDGQVNIVLIDVEGFDADIVCSMNLIDNQPNIIYFEHKHLCAKKIKESIRYLSGYGYKFAIFENDILAFKDDFDY